MNPWVPALIVVVSLVGVAIYIERKFKSLTTQIKPDETLIEWLKSQQQDWQKSQQDINQTLRSTNQNIQHVLTQSTQDMNKRLDNAAQYMSQVAKEVGQMSEIGRSMKQLQEFLQSPKLRGNIRDYADITQLVCLAGLESINAEFLRQKLNQSERLVNLNRIAIIQMKSLTVGNSVKKLN